MQLTSYWGICWSRTAAQPTLWISSVGRWKCVPICFCPTITMESWPPKRGRKTAQMQSRSCEKLSVSTRTFQRLATNWAKLSYRRARHPKLSSSLTEALNSNRSWHNLIISSRAFTKNLTTRSDSQSTFACLKKPVRRQNRKISFSAWKFRLKSRDRNFLIRRLACVLGLVLELSGAGRAAVTQRAYEQQ